MRTEHTYLAGVGAVTGYGWGAAELWRGLLSGKPAATLVNGYADDGHGNAWLAQVPSGGDPADGASRSARALRAAAREAVGDARERGWRPGRTVGVVHALVLPEVEEWRRFYLEEGGQRRVRDYLALMP